MRFSMCWLSLVLAGWLAMASVSRADLVYVGGHADLGVGFELGNLHLHIHAEEDLTLFGGGSVPAGEIDPADLIIGVPGPSIARPAGPAWDFLAAATGDQVWFLPQGTDPNKPFLGIGTEELLPADGWTTPVTWQFNSITTVSGNASQFALWQNDTFGVQQVFASSLLPTNGSQSPNRTGNSWLQNTFAHDHFNYGFTGEGIYDVSFSVSATNATLGQSFNDTVSYRFATGNAITVVPEPSSMILLGLASLGGVALKRYRRKVAI